MRKALDDINNAVLLKKIEEVGISLSVLLWSWG